MQTSIKTVMYAGLANLSQHKRHNQLSKWQKALPIGGMSPQAFVCLFISLLLEGILEMSQLSQYVGFYNTEPTVDRTPASLHLSHQLVEQS